MKKHAIEKKIFEEQPIPIFNTKALGYDNEQILAAIQEMVRKKEKVHIWQNYSTYDEKLDEKLLNRFANGDDAMFKEAEKHPDDTFIAVFMDWERATPIYQYRMFSILRDMADGSSELPKNIRPVILTERFDQNAYGILRRFALIDTL